MMSNLEFVKLWNEIIPFKIKESDLFRPDETFVFNALINYLRCFNSYDISLMINKKNSDDPEERLMFSIRFCRYIDGYYKISDKSNSFFYYDLIHPSPKKTVHMLNHLLNYFVFYEMVKDEVLKVAENKIKMLGDINQQIQTIKNENEERKIKKTMTEKEIRNYERELPELNSKIEALRLETNRQEEEEKLLQLKLKRGRTTLDLLKSKESMLKMKIISEDEVNYLIKNKKNLQVSLKQLNEIEETTQSGNQERSAIIDNRQPAIEKIESTLELYNLNIITSNKELRKKLVELENKVYVELEKRDQYVENIEKFTNQIKDNKKSQDLTKKRLEEVEQITKNEINQQIALLKIENETTDDLKKSLENENSRLRQTTETREYILSMATTAVNEINEACK